MGGRIVINEMKRVLLKKKREKRVVGIFLFSFACVLYSP